MSPIGRGTLPLTKGEVTLRMVAFELYKLDRYADGSAYCDPNIRKAIKRLLKLARTAIPKDSND